MEERRKQEEEVFLAANRSFRRIAVSFRPSRSRSSVSQPTTSSAICVALLFVCREVTYRGELKGLYVLLSMTQAEYLRKSSKKLLATTYKPFSDSLYTI